MSDHVGLQEIGGIGYSVGPSVAATRSIFAGQHDGQHALGLIGVGRIRGMVGKGAVVVVDLEQHLLARRLQRGAVVLAIRVIVGGKEVKASDGGCYRYPLTLRLVR